MKTEFTGKEMDQIIPGLTRNARQRIKDKNIRKPSIRDTNTRGMVDLYSLQDAMWFTLYADISLMVQHQIEAALIVNNINLKKAIDGKSTNNQGVTKDFNFYLHYWYDNGQISTAKNSYLAAADEIANFTFKRALIISVRTIRDELFERINTIFPDEVQS